MFGVSNPYTIPYANPFDKTNFSSQFIQPMDIDQQGCARLIEVNAQCQFQAPNLPLPNVTPNTRSYYTPTQPTIPLSTFSYPTPTAPQKPKPPPTTNLPPFMLTPLPTTTGFVGGASWGNNNGYNNGFPSTNFIPQQQTNKFSF